MSSLLIKTTSAVCVKLNLECNVSVVRFDVEVDGTEPRPSNIVAITVFSECYPYIYNTVNTDQSLCHTSCK